MSLPSITLSPAPTSQDENNNSFLPIGKLKGRTVSLNWNSLNLSISTERLLAFTIGALAFTAFALYKLCAEDQMLLPPHAFLEEQGENGRFDGISFQQMEGYYGSRKRSLTASEGRQIYREINAANLEFGRKALEKNHGTPEQIAINACKTRHAARLLVRELTPETFQKDAEYRDMILFGSKTGLTCSAIWDKYEGNAAYIVEASGRPNTEVNLLTQLIPERLYSAIPENARHALIDFHHKPLQSLYERSFGLLF